MDIKQQIGTIIQLIDGQMLQIQMEAILYGYQDLHTEFHIIQLIGHYLQILKQLQQDIMMDMECGKQKMEA